MNVVSLQQPQRDPKWRMGFIGGSDAVKIIRGDWHDLYNEKIGIAQPSDLSHLFNVQLGTYTEQFNLAWFEQEYGVHVDDVQPEFKKTIEGIPFKATLDGLIREDANGFCGAFQKIGVECKHTSSFKKFDDILTYYYPQIQLYMKVADLSHMYLSVIFGNQWECKLVSQDEAEWLRMLPIFRDFWGHVLKKQPPVAEMPNELPTNVHHMTLDNMVARDVSTDNRFVEIQHHYIDGLHDSKIFEKCKIELKSYVQPNEREVFTNKLSIKRNKRGALTIKIKEINDDVK
jgi:hypothetical protein